MNGIPTNPTIPSTPSVPTVAGVQGIGTPGLPGLPWAPLTIDPTAWSQRIFLVYGPSGSGKTRFAANFPTPLFLSCDPGKLGGALSAASFNIKHMKVDSYEQILSILPTLKAQAGKEFQTVVVDSISYLSQIIMRSILKTSGRELPRFEEWNLSATRLRMLINHFCDVQAHIVFTAVDNMDKDEITGKVFGGPSLPGKLQKELPQACDATLRLFTSTGYGTDGKLKVKYMMRSVPDDIWFAKDRTGLIPPETEVEVFIPKIKEICYDHTL